MNEQTECPCCGSEDWDWYCNDFAVCADCGERFIAETDDEGNVLDIRFA